MHCSTIYNYTARNRKECTLCRKEVVSISDHINWTHHITNDVEQCALCREASDKFVTIKNMTYTLIYYLIQLEKQKKQRYQKKASQVGNFYFFAWFLFLYACIKGRRSSNELTMVSQGIDVYK